MEGAHIGDADDSTVTTINTKEKKDEWTDNFILKSILQWESEQGRDGLLDKDMICGVF